MDASQRQKLTTLLAQQHLAVIVTHGEEWPTATLQAFAETPDLDLLFIMIQSAEKFQNLRKRPKVTVLADSRHNIDASTLEIARASLQGVAEEVPLKSAAVEPLKALFLAKNPFEAPYFGHPELTMVRVKPVRVAYAAAAGDNFKADF